MGGFQRRHFVFVVLGLTSAYVARADDLEFGTASSHQALPPQPIIQAEKVKWEGACPPGTKNEVCRCVVYGVDAANQFVPAKDPPPYCSDPRLKALANVDEGTYLDQLFKIQQENGQQGHDG
jgi:hypothetical protein